MSDGVLIEPRGDSSSSLDFSNRATSSQDDKRP
jgi:hypothetical protein